MIHHYKSIPLDKATPYLSHCIDGIHTYCVETYNNKAYSQSLIEKFDKITEGNIKGFILVDPEDHPQAMVWVEVLTRNHGSLIIYAQNHMAEIEAIERLMESKLAKGCLLELITFTPSLNIQDQLRQVGAIENYRQRMAVFLQENTFEPFQTQYKITPLGDQSVETTTELSVAAHLVSEDYKGYDGLINMDKRRTLQNDIMSNKFGPYNESASCALMDGATMIGFCCYVDIENWGEPVVPWIFDICVHPDFHGLGYGAGLLNYSLQILKEQNLKYAGLAVTNDNYSAWGLYQKMGFSFVEYFYEYVF